MLPKSLQSYGGPYVNAEVLVNPESQVSNEKLNRALEDTAGLTRTGIRAMVHFTPHATTPVVTWHYSVWGSTNAEKPTVTRSSDGKYLITYPATLEDGLGEDETVTFASGLADVMSDNADTARVRASGVAGNTVQVWVRDAAASFSDLTSAATVVVWLR